jgi:hypothetical protein
MVGELEWERPRHRGARDTEAIQRADRHLEVGLVAAHSAAQQLVDAEVIGRERLDIRRRLLDPLQLERARNDGAEAVVLDAQQRVGTGSGSSCRISGDRSVSA